MTIFAMMPRANYTVPTEFSFSVRDSASAVTEDVKVRFRGP